MSSTIIYAVEKGVPPEVIASFANSWGSAPVVWCALCKQAGFGESSWLSGLNDSEFSWNKLCNSEKLTEVDKCMLYLTYDFCYVKNKHLKMVAKGIRTWCRRNQTPAGFANHWPAIADLFDKWAAEGIANVGFQMTTVSENPWEGDWNEDLEEFEMIDWGKAWSLFDESPASDFAERQFKA